MNHRSDAGDAPLELAEDRVRARLTVLEAQVDALADRCRRLEAENGRLRAEVAALHQERTHLKEQNAQARSRVEAMIERLKALE